MTVSATLRYGERTAKSARFDEHPPNSNHTAAWDDYSDVTGAPAYQGCPWCGAAAICSLDAGGWTPPANWIGVYAIQAWGEAHRRWRRGAAGLEPGDTLVLFGPGVHTGVARSKVRADGTFLSEEGNTSPGATGSQWNGGTYALRIRRVSDLYGYVVTHDLLGGNKKVKPHPVDKKLPQPQFRREAKRGALHIWDQGPRVEKLQELLGIDEDGYFGRSTAAAVHAFKERHGLDPIGYVAGERFLTVLRQHAAAKRKTPRTLRRGDKGGLVRKLQRGLIGQGLLPLQTDGWRNDDGDFGPVTERAVKALERKIGRPVNGTAGAAVWKELSR